MRRQKTAAAAPAFTGPIIAANDDTPIAVADLGDRVPWWPLNYPATLKAIRQGRLGHVAVGARRFVTIAMLKSFIAANSKPAAAAVSP